MRPTSRACPELVSGIAMAHPMSLKPSASGSPGCGTSSPTVAMQATNSRTRSRATAGGPSKSSSDRIPPKASRSCRADGWSNAHSHGWAGAAVWPKTGSDPSKVPPHGPPSPVSACSHAESQHSQLIEKLLNQALMPVAARNASISANKPGAASVPELAETSATGGFIADFAGTGLALAAKSANARLRFDQVCT